MNRPIDLILSRLKGPIVSSDGKDWQASCPAHEDNSPSLSVSVGDDDRVLLHCHAGCPFESIVAALGLQTADLFPNRPAAPSLTPSKGLTLAALAEHKSLPDHFMISIGVSDSPKRAGEVLIRYYLADNNLAERHRLRTALSAKDGIRWTGPKGGSIVPYGLWRLRDAEKQGRLIIVEGESDCWTLWHHGFAALGIPGASMTKTLQAEHLAQVKKIYVIKEPDQGGDAFVPGIAGKLKEMSWEGEAFVVSMSDGIKDPNDFHKVHGAAFPEKFQTLLDAATPLPKPEDDRKGTRGGSGKDKKDDKRTPVEKLIDLATKECEFFHTSQKEGFAIVSVKGHRETWSLDSAVFKQWLRRAYYHEHNSVPNQEALQAALNLLEAKANYDGSEHEVFIRVAEVGDLIYLDLCDDDWRAVEITSAEWRVIDNPPVRFRRTQSMQALPAPQKGGSLNSLRNLLNIKDQDTWVLLLAWIVQALRGKGPFPLLVLQGEQGTAKTTTARLIRALIDPVKPPNRTPPRDERDLMIYAKNAWVLSMDNLSGVSTWLSDALCRLATGGGFATRQLFSNSEETVFDATRPMILNGIDEAAQRQDLLDRSLIIRLEPISDSARKTEAELMTEFEAARPGILGALLDGVSAALRSWKSVRLPEKSRMADFVVWATAAETGLGLQHSAFQRAYRAFTFGAVRDSLNDDAVAVALEKFMEGQDSWKGSATELLDALDDLAPDKTKRSRVWPKAANQLTRRLNRLGSFLRKVGLDVTRDREGHQSNRTITVTKCAPGTARTVGIDSPKDAEPAKSPDSLADGQPDAIGPDHGGTASTEEAA